MNQKEYRNLKISKYEDVEEGKKLYRHEKIYDIVKTIEDMVNKSFDEKPSFRQYNKHYLMLSLGSPDSYWGESRKYFVNFIKNYQRAKSSEKKHNSFFRKELYKNFKIDYLGGTYPKIRTILQGEGGLKLDEVQLQRYGGTLSVACSFDGIEAFKGISGFYHPPSKTTFVDNSTTKIESVDTQRHEYFHYLTDMGLMDGEYKYDVHNKITKESKIRHQIKNEILAQYSSGNNYIIEKDLEVKLTMREYVAKFLGAGKYNKELTFLSKIYCKKLGKYIDELTEEEYNMLKEDPEMKIFETHSGLYEKGDGGSVLISDEGIIQNFINYSYKVESYIKIVDAFTGVFLEYLIPKYFDSRDQILYVLAITPLSQWDSLEKYYRGLICKDKVKSDLHEVTNDIN